MEKLSRKQHPLGKAEREGEGRRVVTVKREKGEKMRMWEMNVLESCQCGERCNAQLL